MRIFSSGEVCALLGPDGKPLPFQTLNSWVVNGVIKPVRESTGTGQQRLFSAVQVLAVAIGRGLRHGAFKAGLDIAGDVMEVVMSYTEESLLKRFAEGRRYVAVDNGAGKVVNKLLTQAECQKLAQRSSLVGDMIAPIVIDVQGAWEKVIHLVDGMEAEANRKKETAK